MFADRVVLRRGNEKYFRNLVFRTRGDGRFLLFFPLPLPPPPPMWIGKGIQWLCSSNYGFIFNKVPNARIYIRGAIPPKSLTLKTAAVMLEEPQHSKWHIPESQIKHF
jgi:hypothetical protein